jgi:pyridoxamine 5'-phosphate oxidase
MALTSQTLADLRQDYSLRGLDLGELDADPIVQFQHWLAEAHSHDLIEPNAMTLATVDATGQPWTRTVLLKVCDARGFAFFTNYNGSKASHLAAESRVALTFWWSALERQVNVTGRIVRTSREESEAYFASRPLASQLGAWASPQSSVLETREALEQSFAQQKARFEGLQIPCPEHWGGFRVEPNSVEFWQGRRSRLHDRFRYERSPEGWGITRLAP